MSWQENAIIYDQVVLIDVTLQSVVSLDHQVAKLIMTQCHRHLCGWVARRNCPSLQRSNLHATLGDADC